MIYLVVLIFSFIANANECSIFGPLNVSESIHHSVDDYSTAMDVCKDNNNNTHFAIRYFSINNIDASLIVNPETLASQVVRKSCLNSCSPMNEPLFSASRFGHVIDQSLSAAHPLQNAGVISGESSQKMVSVTIDMCPSKKGISENIYNTLLSLADSSKTAIPVGIAMTKKWMLKYPDHFQWIKTQQLNGRLNILWINHSANHFYDKKLPLNKNFLLAKNTNFSDEVLSNEIALISAGVTPSIFFRFPGLVSSQKQVEQLADWGLVTLGSNAWLALGDAPKTKNSIILIHGNRNEPAGEKLFLNYVEKKSADIAWASVIDLLTLPE
jgi:hypothetical protein